MEVKTINSNKGPIQRGKKKQSYQKAKKMKKEVVETEVNEKVGIRSLRVLWSFKNLKKLKKFFRSLTCLSYLINGFCLGFVIWQTIKCMTKFNENPKGTEISMKLSTDLPCPAITVCGSFGKDKYGYDLGFNSTYVQNVCGIRYKIGFFSLPCKTIT